jgi:glucosamine kinase
MIEFLIGVDGGGSGTRAVVALRDGTTIGRGHAGPSALGQGIPAAWVQVGRAVGAAFAAGGRAMPSLDQCALAAALSGVSNHPWRDAFVATNPGYGQLVVETDSYAMLLGAHGGQPGAIVAAGTGSVGEVLHRDGSRLCVGGWGFPTGDEGSGAWIGLHAVRLAQYAIDGRVNAGPLVRHVWEHCGSSRDSLQAWCDHAGQFAYAQLATAVFDAEPGDPAAAQILIRAAASLDIIAVAIDPHGGLPLAVCGSVGLRLESRLSPPIRARCVPVAAGPVEGALVLARRLVEGGASS